MSLHWDFEKDFVGVALRRSEFNPDTTYWEFIYTGNALLTFLSEYPYRGPFGNQEPKEGEWGYSLRNFYSDKEHLKNCLKDKELYDGTEYVKIILKPCEAAYTFIKEIKGLWPVEITNIRSEWMKELRERCRNER